LYSTIKSEDTEALVKQQVRNIKVIGWRLKGNLVLLLLGRQIGMSYCCSVGIKWYQSFNDELSFFLYHTSLSNRIVDGYQMYSGGSVVRKASLIDPEILPSLP